MSNRAEATRTRLINATVELLCKQGVAGTTFVDVAKHAGLSRGAIHHHYANRVELFSAVIDHVGQLMRESIREKVHKLPDSEPSLTLIVDLVWEQIQEDEYRAFAQLRAALMGDNAELAPLKDKMRMVSNNWASAASQLRTEQSRSNSELPRIVLNALAGAMMNYETLGAPPWDPDMSAFRDQLKQLIAIAELSAPATH